MILRVKIPLRYVRKVDTKPRVHDTESPLTQNYTYIGVLNETEET